MSPRRTLSSDFSSRQQRMWRRNQNTTRFASTISLGPVSHTVLVSLMVAVLGLIYLTQMTKTSTFGYEEQRRNESLAAMMDQKRDLEIENARLQALERVSNSSVASAMTQPASVEYARN